MSENLPQVKSCSQCQSEIPLKAKRCPQCQADIRSWFARHPILTGILGLVVLVGFGSALGGGDSDEQTSARGESQQAQAEQRFTVGESFRSNRIEITVQDVSTRSSVGSSFFGETASEGGVLVAVQWRYKNISDEPIGMFSKPTIKLVDSNGVEFSRDIGKSSAFATELELDRKIVSDLNPDITVNDAEVFEVGAERFAQPGWHLEVRADRNTYKIDIAE